MKKLNLHYVIFILIMSILFGVCLAWFASSKNKDEIYQYVVSNPIQVILIDDAYYFPPTNNSIINAGAQLNPELTRQKCQSMQMQGIKLIYENGTFATFNGDIYLPSKVGRTRPLNNFLKFETVKEKFQTFCNKHF